MISTYFLGGSSVSGFQTKFHQVIHTPGYFTYILKGGPGTGKSTLMKKIARHFEQCDVDLYYCSSDISSLDAVVIHDFGAILVDGTAPHVFNADFPGIAQTLVDLGQYWDRSKLSDNEQEIRRCFFENARYHRRARSFISALSYVNGSMYDQAMVTADTEGVYRAAVSIADALPETGSSAGRCQYKQFAAITSEGYKTQPLPKDCHITAVKDDWYAAGFLLLEELKELLLQKGYDIIVSECILFPENKTEHIFVPSEKILFSAVNGLNKLSLQPGVECSAFYRSSAEMLELSHSMQAALTLESEAAYSIRKALLLHDELESHYIDALCFEELDTVTQKIIDEIEGMA